MNAGTDGEELGFEDRAGVCGGGDFRFVERFDGGGRGGEVEASDDVGWDDLGEGEVVAKDAVVTCWSLLDELVELRPIAVGELVANLFTGKRAVLIAEHSNVGIVCCRMGQ